MALSDILKQKREAKGLTQEHMADLLGVSKRAYQYYEEGRNEPKRPALAIISEALGIKPSELYEQNVPHETISTVGKDQNPDETYLTRRRLLKQNHNKKIPFYDAAANGGAELYYSEMTPVSAPAGTIDVGDLLNDSECALRVYGNSMIPNYPPGCVVGLIKCTKSFIEPGEVYVIETIDRRVIKRLFYKNDDPETSTFTCYSDNTLKFEGGARDGKQAYPIFNIELKDIVNLYQVTGVIKRNSNSVIINR